MAETTRRVHRFHSQDQDSAWEPRIHQRNRDLRDLRDSLHQFVRKMITEFMGWKNWDVFSGISPYANLVSLEWRHMVGTLQKKI